MGWFLYKDSKPRYRKGICLRVNHLISDPELGRLIRKAGRRFVLDIAEICERNKDGVLIQLWFKNPQRMCQLYSSIDSKQGTNVVGEWKIVSVRTPENPEWVCESDIGRGLVGVE